MPFPGTRRAAAPASERPGAAVLVRCCGHEVLGVDAVVDPAEAAGVRVPPDLVDHEVGHTDVDRPEPGARGPLEMIPQTAHRARAPCVASSLPCSTPTTRPP